MGPASADADLGLQKIAKDVYAIVGDPGNRSPQNLGNNATFDLVITSAGVVLIDPGGTYLGARQIDAVIDRVTDKPVVTVINTGGQDHRWLGNGYFSERGATIVASRNAVADQKSRVRDQFIGLASWPAPYPRWPRSNPGTWCRDTAAQPTCRMRGATATNTC